MRHVETQRLLVAVSWLLLATACGSGQHALTEPKSGLKLALPKHWTQWDRDKLKSPEATQARIVGYAGDPEKHALVSIRRFVYRRAGAKVAITGDVIDRIKPEDREKLFEVLAEQAERDLAEGTQSWRLDGVRHSDSLPRGYFLELTGQIAEPGESLRWLQYVLVLSRNSDEIIEVRISAPMLEKAKYQGDLDLVNGSLRAWING